MTNGDSVLIERNGKHVESYTVSLRLNDNEYFVTRDNDEKPKHLYLYDSRNGR